MVNIEELEGIGDLLRESSALHDHLCPRQVLGVRTGMLAARLFGIDLPQQDKRLMAFVETDGCFTDGVSVASGCRLGRRTMRLVDYGKAAVTFADTVSNKAVRIYPNPSARERAWHYAPDAPDRWHAQLEGYKRMPTCELLLFKPVQLQVSLAELVGAPGLRSVCDHCGEEIMNGREVVIEDKVLCRYCAGTDIYYLDL